MKVSAKFPVEIDHIEAQRLVAVLLWAAVYHLRDATLFGNAVHPDKVSAEAADRQAAACLELRNRINGAATAATQR